MKGSHNIWVWARHRDGEVEPVVYGLLAEARRLRRSTCVRGEILAVAIGRGQVDWRRLKCLGADRVLWVNSTSPQETGGEAASLYLAELVRQRQPGFILLDSHPDTVDLGVRLAARLAEPLATKVVDLNFDGSSRPLAVRLIGDGSLYEEVALDGQGPIMLSFLESGLDEPQGGSRADIPVEEIAMTLPDMEINTLMVERVVAPAGSTPLTDAEIIVAGGRGTGADGLELLKRLADLLGGSLAGSRPLVDEGALDQDQQIGQSGATVKPRLLMTCGISGAVEFTVGMDRARHVISINTDPGARIFEFADLALEGDVQHIVPLLIERLTGGKSQ